MDKKVCTIFLAAMLLALSACTSVSSTQGENSSTSSQAVSYKKMTAEEAKDMMDAGGVTIIDVRTKEEYDTAHVPGAVLIPLDELPARIPALLESPESPVLVYCRTGVRGKMASEALISLGYQKVYDFGGIVDWPYDVTASGENAVPLEDASVPELIPGEKQIPGCRSTLPFPLIMTGESEATDFASPWSAETLGGDPVTQEVLQQSQLTLVHAWGTYCVSCLRDLQELQKLYEMYPRNQLNILAAVASVKRADGSLDEGDIAISKQIVEEAKTGFTQLMPSDDLIQIRLHELNRIPEYFFLDRDGNIVGETLYGSHTAEELSEIVDGLLS